MTLNSFQPFPGSALEGDFTPNEIQNLQSLGYVDEDSGLLSGLTVCDHPSGVIYADEDSKKFHESYEDYEAEVLILCEEIRTEAERIKVIGISSKNLCN